MSNDSSSSPAPTPVVLRVPSVGGFEYLEYVVEPVQDEMGVRMRFAPAEGGAVVFELDIASARRLAREWAPLL
ncbi:hypothetical protein [Microbacterium testaceum]|uniref:hypothetical protein n=1 Tax=Microbacterium testaceum TaxID=2033 RepID=UPI00128EB991|nr:hypothetical protein [Microbacterium testaceum]